MKFMLKSFQSSLIYCFLLQSVSYAVFWKKEVFGIKIGISDVDEIFTKCLQLCEVQTIYNNLNFH